MTTRVRVWPRPTCVTVELPCGHQRARVPYEADVTRRCGTCRRWYFVRRTDDPGVRAVTDTTCAVCGGDLEGESDIWHCRSCGSEFDNPLEDI
jgi:hypothetical protein